MLTLDHRLVGIETDTAATADVVRHRFQEFLSTDVTVDVPSAFGVRAEGRRGVRRQLALLYHGSRVIQRRRSLDDAVDALRQILSTLDVSARDGEVLVSMRIFARGDRAVFVDVAPPLLSGDRALAQLGIEELPTWRAVVDVPAATVVAAHPLRLTGIVAESADGPAEAVLQRLWILGDGPARREWADLLAELDLNGRVRAAPKTGVRRAIEELLGPV